MLPEWLAQPSVITADIRSKRVDLKDIEGLDDHILEKLKENGITYFFPGIYYKINYASTLLTYVVLFIQVSIMRVLYQF